MALLCEIVLFFALIVVVVVCSEIISYWFLLEALNDFNSNISFFFSKKYFSTLYLGITKSQLKLVDNFFKSQ